jgi:hypothetical protein
VTTLPALMLLAVLAAPVGQRPGSAQFQVSVRVVAPMRANAPAAVTLGPATAIRGASGDCWIVRLAPSASLPGGGSGVLIGAPGQAMRPCGGEREPRCQVTVEPASGAGTVVALVFVPDGAPSAIVER